MAARSIIIDTDPGQDDAIAILLALASAELEVLGITTVAGNVRLELTALNARKVCELAGRPQTKVFAGCAGPLVRAPVTAEEVHGKTGLDGPDLPAPHMPLQQQHAVDWIVDSLRAAPAGSITLCTLGPLTNIAAALIKAPDVVPRIAAVVMMGGGFFEGGNVTPSAEFNVYVDPHAAHVVLTSGVKLVMHPLDVTHKALMDQAWIDSLRALGNRTGAAAAAMLDFYERFDMEKYGTAGGPLHDPCVIAYLLQPELFGGKDCNVAVETGSELTMGMTVVDWWRVTKRPVNCRVINRIDAAGYYELLRSRLARLP